MALRNLEAIDGVGLEQDGSAVVLLISDDVPWTDPDHIPALSAKLEAYANAVISGALVESYPDARGKPATIRLVWQHEPTDQARAFLTSAKAQLSGAGIAFADMALPDGY